MRGDGPLSESGRLVDGRQRVPSGHAPRLEAVHVYCDADQTGRYRVRECDAPTAAWIDAETPMPIRD